MTVNTTFTQERVAHKSVTAITTIYAYMYNVYAQYLW